MAKWNEALRIEESAANAVFAGRGVLSQSKKTTFSQEAK
jgi:hypothetical protein